MNHTEKNKFRDIALHSIQTCPYRSAEEKLDPETEIVTLDGKAIVYQEFTYVMMHKPAGVLSATEDKREKTVLDLLPPELQKQELSCQSVDLRTH